VRPTTFRYRAAVKGATEWNRPGRRRKALAWLAASGAASVGYAVTATTFNVGAACVVAAATVVGVLFADNWAGARRAVKNRPKYRSFKARRHHMRQRFYARRMRWFDEHPVQARIFDAKVRWYQVTVLGPQGPKGTPRARTVRMVRGTDGVKRLNAKALKHKWEPQEAVKVMDPMEKVRRR